jgi:hypothetical protein
MKIFKRVVLALALLTIVPSVTFAGEIIREEDGKKCFDLEAMYEEVNNTSQALTGKGNSIDAVKKAQTVATLTNIMSILIGDRIYCVNDEVAAAKSNSLKDIGVLGQITEANSHMLSYFPSMGVTEHLAQEFIPGYDGNNAILAADGDNDDAPAWDIQQAFQNAMKSLIDFLGKIFFEDFDIENYGDPELVEQVYTEVYDKVFTQIEEELSSSVDNKLTEMENLVEEIEESQDKGEEVTKSGYNYLKDYLHLDSVWKMFRNIAYVFFIIIMIIAGFMIMFRKKLPGQVVVSLGNTLPQVILGIILVTFSFSIVGIVMDAGKFSMNVVSNVFVSAYEDAGVQWPEERIVSVESLGSLANQAMQAAKREGLIMRVVKKIPIFGERIVDLANSLGKTIVNTAFETFAVVFINMQLDTAIKEDVNIDAAPGVDAVLDPAVEVVELGFDTMVLKTTQILLIPFLVRNIILLLVTLYASFKLFITMIATYLKLFMNVVFGPIQIAFGSLPGNFSMTTKWFKSVVANVLVFVGIHLIINLFSFLSMSIDTTKFNFFGNKGVFWPNWIISFEGVILIGGYLFASSMPKIINGMLQVEQSKEMAAAGQAVKQAASKIPLVGGMFGS